MISEVVPGLYRGPRPTETDYMHLERLRVKSILNLEDDQEAIRAEREWCDIHNIKFYSLPMSEIWRPHKWQLQRAVNIMLAPYDLPLFVHCLHGQDRTGYAVAAYREIVQKWPFSKAYKEAKAMGHKWWFAPYLLLWPKSLKEL